MENGHKVTWEQGEPQPLSEQPGSSPKQGRDAGPRLLPVPWERARTGQGRTEPLLLSSCRPGAAGAQGHSAGAMGQWGCPDQELSTCGRG